jgi:serine/threonine protein kinase
LSCYDFLPAAEKNVDQNEKDSLTKTMPIPLDHLTRGKVFAGRYEIIEELGKGGMGRVFRVFDKKIEEEIALKFLNPEIAADKQTVERFRNELKFARRVIHKNVCRVFDLNDAEGVLFITMEYVPGENLKSLVRRSGQLTVEKSISIARQLSEGLAEAHGLGLIHRDLKPQNIMIDKQGQARIMDFGIARSLTTAGTTEAGLVMGTPEYMSPEQISGEDVDQRSDIYSLGVILYEMVTGRAPFSGETPLSLAMKHKTEAPKDPTAINAQIPRELSRVILKCLEKDKIRRYQSAGELREDLGKVEQGTALVDVSPRPGKSIAVLPFKDLSPQHDQDYFCEGLAEELINALTRVKDLRVAARTSSFSFKGKEIDIREIGKKLNVSTVLEGSVQKSGQRLRITAQLINIADGYHLWSERFDRDMKDIFAVQDEISMAIVDKMKVGLLEGEKEKITKRHTQNEDAYNLYLQGLYFWNRRYKGDMIRAVDFYQRSIAKDPNYVLPFVGIADVFNIFGQWAFVPPRDAYARSKAMLQKALEIDNSVSEIYSSLGFAVMGYEWDLPATEKYYRRSLELNASNVYAHGWYAIDLGVMKRYEEALSEATQAVELDPLFGLVHGLYGMVLALCGQVEKGREEILKAIAMEPDQPMLYLFMGMFSLFKPSFPARAIEYLEKAAGFGLTFALGYLGLAYAMAGRRDDALSVLGQLEKIEKERFLPPLKKIGVYLKPGLRHFRSLKKKYVSPLLKALVYLGLHMMDKTLDCLEESGRERDYFLPALLMGVGAADVPWFDEITQHPRFKALQEKIKQH